MWHYDFSMFMKNDEMKKKDKHYKRSFILTEVKLVSRVEERCLYFSQWLTL